MHQERLLAQLSGAFGMLALLLAAIGLYGVSAYATSRRRGEIGVRLALGAARSAVIGLVMRGIIGPLAGGVLCGAIVSVWLAQFVGTVVWGLQPRDPVTFTTAAAILTVVGLVAGWVPAWRAARMNPLEAIRS